MKLNLYLISLIFIVIFLSGCTPDDMNRITGKVFGTEDNFITNETIRTETKIQFAQGFANAVIQSNLKEIHLENIQSHEDYKAMVDNLNLLIGIVNQHVDKKITILSKEFDAYEKFTKSVNKYTPLIGEYNALIQASHNFNSLEEETANILI